ncbi:hypothetical protein Syn8016DRAFT_0788 [Synechococcus sp. WH 8016]|nr:hypothetical protein Syn8016DRAFT_0788 [Synechococcus sp. WH 8016]
MTTQSEKRNQRIVAITRDQQMLDGTAAQIAEIIKHPSHVIHRVCQGNRQTVGGWTCRYLNDIENDSDVYNYMVEYFDSASKPVHT